MNQGTVDFITNALRALESVPAIIEGAGAALQLVQNTRERFDAMVQQDRGPTHAEREAQDALIEQLRNELHAPEGENNDARET